MHRDQPYSPWNSAAAQPWDIPDQGNVTALRGEDPDGCAPSDVDPHGWRYDGPMCFPCGIRYPAGDEHCNKCGRPTSPRRDYTAMATAQAEISACGRSETGSLIGAAILLATALFSLFMVGVAIHNIRGHHTGGRLAAMVHGFAGGQ